MKKAKQYFKQYKKIIIPTLAFIIILVSLIIIKTSINTRNNKYIETYKEEELIKEPKQKESEGSEEIDENSQIYYVDIKGAVKTPGVYALEAGKRVKDVIDLAGGLTENSDTSLINLAASIHDEMVIVIYSKEEVDNSNKKFELSTQINDAYQENTENNKKNESNSITNNESNIININTASKEQLMTLPGIGESKAQAIISYREENGNFTSTEDIMQVKGIGQAIYEKIKDSITV